MATRHKVKHGHRHSIGLYKHTTQRYQGFRGPYTVGIYICVTSNVCIAERLNSCHMTLQMEMQLNTSLQEIFSGDCQEKEGPLYRYIN